MKLICSMLWGGHLRTWFWIFLLSIFLHNTDCTISQENHSDECKVTSVDEELKRGEEVIYRIIHWKVSSFITYMWTDSIIKDMFSFSIQFQKTLCLHNVSGTEDTEKCKWSSKCQQCNRCYVRIIYSVFWCSKYMEVFQIALECFCKALIILEAI